MGSCHMSHSLQVPRRWVDKSVLSILCAEVYLNRNFVLHGFMSASDPDLPRKGGEVPHKQLYFRTDHDPCYILLAFSTLRCLQMQELSHCESVCLPSWTRGRLVWSISSSAITVPVLSLPHGNRDDPDEEGEGVNEMGLKGDLCRKF